MSCFASRIAFMFLVVRSPSCRLRSSPNETQLPSERVGWGWGGGGGRKNMPVRSGVIWGDLGEIWGVASGQVGERRQKTCKPRGQRKSPLISRKTGVTGVCHRWENLRLNSSGVC